MTRLPARSVVLLLLLTWTLLGAARATAAEEKAAASPPPEERQSVTHHTLSLGSSKITYTATAGTYLLRDEEGKAKASVFFVAYTLDGEGDAGRRPVTFAFNGGPGAAAVWLHLGAFGPKRVDMSEEGMPLPPPGRLVDNDLTLLPETDLVFIDPVSTGFSRPVNGEDGSQFHGVQQDVEAVGEFIRHWLARNGRFSSPKYLAGESYGTARAAALSLYLQERFGIYPNGLILISVVLNWQNQELSYGNDIPYLIYLPTYTATAHYHGKLPSELSKDLGATLAEVERFALGDYALALLAGNRLSPERRKEIAARVARYTGLDPTYVEASDLRIRDDRFRNELLREKGRMVGRLDGRFLGWDRDAVGESQEYDPAMEAVMIGYVDLLNDYLRRDLGYSSDAVYEFLSPKVRPWSFDGWENRFVNVGEHLRQAMVRNPSLKVLAATGYYDFATPYFDAYQTFATLGLPPALTGNVEIVPFESGHMMYIRRIDHIKLTEAIRRLFKSRPGYP
ncbi:MAG TPA: peptidase S10 [Thermoanaerobaculia bacterium]|nr:peptidase S10 [Thermoanaerobaculia bacterium]